jgi:hypothetical protein
MQWVEKVGVKNDIPSVKEDLSIQHSVVPLCDSRLFWNYASPSPSGVCLQHNLEINNSGSISDEVIGFCSSPNPSRCTVALG